MDDPVSSAAASRQEAAYLSPQETAFYLGLSARKLQQMRARGVGPRFRRQRGRVSYHIDDIEEWSKGNHPVTPRR